MPWQKYVGNVSREWGNNLEKTNKKTHKHRYNLNFKKPWNKSENSAIGSEIWLTTLLNSRNSQDLLDIHPVA